MWDVEVDDVFSMLFEEQGGSAHEAGGETNGLGSLWLSWQTSDPPDIRNTWQNFDKPLNGWSAPSLTSQQPGQRLVTTQAPFTAAPNMQRSSTDLSSSSSSVIQVSNSLSSDPCSSTLPSRSSSGMAAEGSSPSQYIQIGPEGGWQSLLSSVLDDPPPAALAVPPAPSRRGRKPTGGTTKPVKDKKRENRILIKQLEQDLANKLNIVKQLEGQNVELKRKEKLLKLSVDTSEHNMTRLVDPGLDRSLKHMLQSFRSAYNRSTAERVLSKIGHIKEPKDMNFQVFCTCWNALVMEMCDSLMADATASTPAAKQESERHMSMMYHKTIDFVTAMCVHDCNIIVEAQQRNLVTGELLTDITLDFWSSVVDKMDFSDEQLKDLVGAYDMFVRCNERNLKERQAVKEELAAAMALQEGELESHGHNTCHGAMAVQEASDRLSANLVRCNTLHTMISFLALRIMTPRQTAQMGMHSSPTFPSPRHVLAAAYHKAVAKGLAPARALTEWDIPLDMQHL